MKEEAGGGGRRSSERSGAAPGGVAQGEEAGGMIVGNEGGLGGGSASDAAASGGEWRRVEARGGGPCLWSREDVLGGHAVLKGGGARARSLQGAWHAGQRCPSALCRGRAGARRRVDGNGQGRWQRCPKTPAGGSAAVGGGRRLEARGVGIMCCESRGRGQRERILQALARSVRATPGSQPPLRPDRALPGALM
eukprot:567266-Rhodomonas_salina.1